MVGQAATLNNEEWARLEKHCASETHKLIWALLRFTGARINEVLQLRVEDVYFNGKPRESILYRKETRKGHDKNHSVPVSNVLRCYLSAYRPPATGYLFPRVGVLLGDLHTILWPSILTNALSAGLSHKRVKTHSGRCSLVGAG